jgi:preprotein translocase subunit SecD
MTAQPQPAHEAERSQGSSAFGIMKHHTTMKHLVLGFTLAFATLAAFTACTTTRESSASSRDPVTIQMRLVQDTPSSDSSEMIVVQGAESPAHNEVLNVQDAVLIDQTAVKTAKLQKDSLDRPQITIVFTDDGRERFAEVTRENIGKRLGIVIGGQLYSAPTIMSEISGGKVNISGSFSEMEARDLVKRINASLK